MKKPYTVSYWSDYDEDGDSDLFMASGPGGSPGLDHHYKNMLTETGVPDLQRIDNELFATDQQDGQCYNFIDYDLDGDRDLYLTNYGGASNRFYLNEEGNFVSTTNTLVFNNTSLANAWGDFDLDGDEDVIITADNLGSGGYFLNNGDGSFTKKANIFALHFPSNSNVSGITVGDYDNDGDLDFFAQGGINGSNGSRALFRNDLVSLNNWVNFQLVNSSNSSAALGAKIRVKADLEGDTTWLQREVSAQNTFMGHNSLRQHFGLGEDMNLDSVIVKWSSGLEEVYTDIAANRFYTLQEGSGISTNTKQVPSPPIRLSLFPNPVDTEYIQVNKWWENNQASLTLEIYNLEGRLMLSQVLPSTTNEENTRSIPTPLVSNGTYLIRMRHGKRTAISKIVINR